ncbi:MAG: hypothetical protein J7M05_00535, partial [Anaerolineae bacterium]|nr:hypothetical protein [Anaerolineae bacterium]
HAGKTIWYAPVLGAPLAAFAVHCAAILGAKGVLQIGSFGGTQKGMRPGELLLVTAAGRGEGASQWYLPPGEMAYPDEELLERLRAFLKQKGLSWREAPVFTTSAFMAETWADILRWEREGYAGVEMEAASTFAVAQHLGLPSAALLFLYDHLIEGQHMTNIPAEERQQVKRMETQLEGLALEFAVQWA